MEKDGTLARMAFLDVVDPLDRLEILLVEERRLSQEISRLRSASVPTGFRREARRASVERLEAMRRWVRSLAQHTMHTASGTAKKK
jgi:hypothetical protein